MNFIFLQIFEPFHIHQMSSTPQFPKVIQHKETIVSNSYGEFYQLQNTSN
jgi:hypothetical protein